MAGVPFCALLPLLVGVCGAVTGSRVYPANEGEARPAAGLRVPSAEREKFGAPRASDGPLAASLLPTQLGLRCTGRRLGARSRWPALPAQWGPAPQRHRCRGAPRSPPVPGVPSRAVPSSGTGQAALYRGGRFINRLSRELRAVPRGRAAAALRDGSAVAPRGTPALQEARAGKANAVDELLPVPGRTPEVPISDGFPLLRRVCTVRRSCRCPGRCPAEGTGPGQRHAAAAAALFEAGPFGTHPEMCQ